MMPVRLLNCGSKSIRFLTRNQHTEMKFNCISRLRNIGHDFRKKKIFLNKGKKYGNQVSIPITTKIYENLKKKLYFLFFEKKNQKLKW